MYMKTLLLILLSSSLSFAECLSPDGAIMQTGDTLILFTTEYKPTDNSCIDSLRECKENGKLSGNSAAIYTQCLDERTCEHPFSSEPMNDQQSVVTYLTPDAPCKKETRVCDGKTGILSGSFLNDICKEKK